MVCKEPCASMSGFHRDVHQQAPVPRVAGRVYCPAHTHAHPCPRAPLARGWCFLPSRAASLCHHHYNQPVLLAWAKGAHGCARSVRRVCMGLGGGRAVLAAVPVLRTFHTAGAPAVLVLGVVPVLGAVPVLDGVLVLVLGAVLVFSMVLVLALALVQHWCLLWCWCSVWCRCWWR